MAAQEVTQEAIELLEETRSGRERALGAACSDTLASRSELARARAALDGQRSVSDRLLH